MLRGYLFAFLFLLSGFIQVSAQKTCVIAIPSYNGCIPHPVNFDVATTGGTPSKYEWDFGDGTAKGTVKDPGHVYTKRGKFTVSVKITFADGTTCTATHPKQIQIYDNPKADFNVAPNAVVLLCHQGEKYCFRDLTLPGGDGAAIEDWVWDFGDGGLSTERNPCYAYSSSGTYIVSLEARDSNGCKKLVQKTIQVKFASQMNLIPKVKFKAGIKYDCAQQKASVFFTNLTDTAGYGITKYTWEFGDGTRVSCDLSTPACVADWLNQKHDYTKSGTYKPTLYVETRNGCKTSYFLDTAISLDPYKLSVSISPADTLCHSRDSVIQFYAAPHSKASYYIWDYGDPFDTDQGRLPYAQHTYKQPDTYTIRFRTKVNGCIFDTTFCQKVILLGPSARIMRYHYKYEPWDSIPRDGTGIISRDRYLDYFDTSCYGAGYVPYYTYDTAVIANGDTTFSYCGTAITGYITDSVYDHCLKDSLIKTTPIRKPKVVRVTDKKIVSGTMAFWTKGDSWPPAPVYSIPPFNNDPLKMDDTAIFSLRCGPPQRVDFTNFSTKFRGQEAVDDVPPGRPDTCVNPSYPFASDSLRFHWDFGEGDPITSTKQKPDDLARYSTERLPSHLYTKAGCYWVKLTTYDPATKCTDEEEMPIVVQAPEAGWDPVYGTKMNWVKQQNIPPNSPPKGMQLVGLPCRNAVQGIEYAETKPFCYKRDFAFIPDSAAMSQRESCDTTKVRHNWLSRDFITKKMAFRHEYSDTGWKTIGAVVTNNYACSDTAWYHNYKYIHGVFPSVSLDKKQLCIGGRINLTAVVKEQPGMKLFYIHYIVEGLRGDILKVHKDTFRFTTLGLKKDTATSTVHNPDWGLDDPAGVDFNFLYDTISMAIDTPGHVRVKSYGISRFGCIDSSEVEFTVGHHAEMFTGQPNLCLGDPAHFEAYADYYLPFSVSATGYDTIDHWTDPIGSRGGRKPAIIEKVEWDMDGNGTIDATGIAPKYIYTKPGIYTVRLITTDSSGCRQVINKKDYIKVMGISAYFGIDSPGALRYCAPHFYQFRDSSYVLDSVKSKNIASWTWDFGDGAPPIVITDPARRDAAHLYIRNGDYTVTLTVKTYDGTGADQLGCSESYSRLIRIVGPRADFMPLTPLEGCVPFTVKMLDRSGNTAVHEWNLGDETQTSSKGEDTVYLTYLKPGSYCPQLIVADTIVDFFGNLLYCSDSSARCQYRVIVHDTSRITLKLTDTVICVNEEFLGITAVQDTGYASWKVEYGDGRTDTFHKPSFAHIYSDTGYFFIRMTGRNGYCPDTGSARVRVLYVVSDFYLDSFARDTPYFSFINTSRKAVKYKWEIDDGSPPFETSELAPFRHEFRKAGKVNICLTAYNKKGCFQKVCREVEIFTGLNVYNVFTPGSADGKNDRFVIDIQGETLYDLEIYNRWGELVFASRDKNKTWNGTHAASGALYPTGIYYYVFRYRHIGAAEQKVHGTVTLLR